MDILEAYKLLGATLGIAVTVFTLWDRMLRYRPSVSITAQHNQGSSRVSLRVKNQAPYDIIIEQIDSTSLHYRVDSARSMLGIIHGVEGNVLSVLLAPNEERFLPIREREIAGVAAENSSGRVRFDVCWTRGDHPFLRPFSVRLWTSPEDIERRKQASEIWTSEQSDRTG
jgi:hypothetical protein